MRTLCIIAFVAACGVDTRTGDEQQVPLEPDPLNVSMTAAPGSLDDLHARVIAKRCSGQPGLCHNGQFEPNLSTPALTYAYVVNRPALEIPTRLRVTPGNAAASLFIDKIRNRNGVATQMPLGAEPMAEAEIQEIEAWINAGALRAPGAAPPPTLNNPPKRPQIGIFSSSNSRLDGSGPVSVAVGTTLTLRHTVSDFETPDATMPFTALVLKIADGRDIVLEPTSMSPQVGPTTYDSGGPNALGEIFNYQRTWTIPATLNLRAQNGTLSTAPASGQMVQIIVVYFDQAPQQGGIVALDFAATPIEIQ